MRPGELLEDEDFAQIKKYLDGTFEMDSTEQDIMSYIMYPKVFEDYLKAKKDDLDLTHMDSEYFFHGIVEGETGDIAVSEGRIITVRMIEVREADEEGNSTVNFVVNGGYRSVKVPNHSVAKSMSIVRKPMADQDNSAHIGANIPGTVIKINVSEGQEVKEGEPILVLEAMKMETNVLAPRDGKVERILTELNAQVEAGELIVELEV